MDIKNEMIGVCLCVQQVPVDNVVVAMCAYIFHDLMRHWTILDSDNEVQNSLFSVIKYSTYDNVSKYILLFVSFCALHLVSSTLELYHQFHRKQPETFIFVVVLYQLVYILYRYIMSPKINSTRQPILILQFYVSHIFFVARSFSSLLLD